MREVRSLKHLMVSPVYLIFIMSTTAMPFLWNLSTGLLPVRCKKDTLDNDFFERMNKVLDDIHEKGVTHCDLRSAGNTLITPDHQPWLVDFVASIHQSSRWNLLGRWIFDQFVEADYGAVLKLKKRLGSRTVNR